MFFIFDSKIRECLDKLDEQKLYEMRIRATSPIKILYANVWGYLSVNGFSISKNNSIIATVNDVESIVIKATERSLYSECENLAKNFITLSNGCRIGVCGEAVTLNGAIRTIKNFSSVIIRFPHEIADASSFYLDWILENNEVKNTLILSPPGGGKPTILRSLSKNLSTDFNTLIIDERNELAGSSGQARSFSVGECDVICGAIKSSVMENAIRSCAPDVIITDEISDKDYESIKYAVSCGVKVITSIHASSILNLAKKPNFERFFSDKIFSRFIVLQGRENPGKCRAVYNGDKERIF